MTSNEIVRGKDTVLDEVACFVGRYLALPSEHCLTVIVLWAAHTWATPAFYVSPRLIIDSAEPGSGKTRVLELLALVCHSAKLTLSTTTAALYRRIAAAKDRPPTVLQDEADAVFGKTNNPQTEDLRALFNAGYKRGATVDRCETEGKSIRVREFPVYAPVTLAGLAGKMPATITDRAAAVIHMRRRAPDESVAEFRERDAAQHAAPIRNRLEAWAEDNMAALEQCRPVMPDGVRDRPAEVWEALLAVADVAGGEWPVKARRACVHFVLQSDPDALSFGVRLLRDVRVVFADRDRMFSSDLVSALIADEESEWSNLWGKPLDQNRLAKELKRYGIKSDRVRIGEGQARGYAVDGPSGLAQAWHRYLPDTTDVRPSRPSRPDAGQDISEASHTRHRRPEGVPAQTPAEQDLFEKETPVTPVTPNDGDNNVTQIPTHRRKRTRNKFRPPTGPGRCQSCGWHIESMGHSDECTANAAS
jgi:hypothetical protein